MSERGPACEEFEAQVAELALGQLAEPERARLFAHAARCARCTASLADLSAVVDQLLALGPQVEPPTGFDARVLARLAPASSSRRPWALAAAVAVVVGVLAGAVLRDTGSPGGSGSSGTVLAADGDPVGLVEVAGDPPQIVVTMDGPATWPGTWTCELRTAAGAWVPVGSWTAADVDDHEWTTAVAAHLEGATAMRIRRTDGTVIATAALERPS